MMTLETAKRILAELLPEGAAIKTMTRKGQRCQVVIKDGQELFSAKNLVELADVMEEEARKLPMTFNHPDTHLFKGPATIEPDFKGNRGDFYLVGNGIRVHLHWVDYGRRWVATLNGGRLVYGREFKMNFSNEERNYPAIRAWFC